ncbi:MAG: hypothetical protein L6R43_14905 [Planctomycetes bacterium]|nr:hypothetical protein [Planctomycetota bacterium]
MQEEDYVICVAPIPDAGWTARVPLRVATGQCRWNLEIPVDIGRTLVVRLQGLRVLAGPAEVRLLQQDGSVAASVVNEGLPPEGYDIGTFGEHWGCVEAFRDLAPGTYRLEAATKDGPVPGTPRTVVISETEAVILDVGRAVPFPPPGAILAEGRDSSAT